MSWLWLWIFINVYWTFRSHKWQEIYMLVEELSPSHEGHCSLSLINFKRQSDVCGSMHQSTIHKEKSNKIQQCIKILYSIFIWSSTCFGRHTAHHQEPKTALAASGFSNVKGCWICSWWTLSGTYYAWQHPPTTHPTTFHVWKTRGCQCSFRLLMIGSVWPKTH